IAGFLLTAVGNWTSRETATGASLVALCALWLLGRVSMVASPLLPPWLIAITDLAFLPALAVAIGRPLFATKNRKNAIMLGVLAALWLANLTMHLDVLGVLPGWRGRGSAVGVDVVLFVILVIAGRTFPMFTRNAIGGPSIRSFPALDRLTLIGMGVVTICDAALATPAVLAAAAGSTSVLALVRSAGWGARYSFKVPLLWVLHVGYLWIPVGLALRAVALFSGAVPPSVATHALTVGAIGTLTLGMMARVALGHTGRSLVASPSVVASFVLVTLAALVRVVVPLLDIAHYRASVFVAAALWTSAFGLYLAVHVPILASSRVDSKPG
ncbi:MAG: NnrS family protein, partial [Polyangiaceae bacterium]